MQIFTHGRNLKSIFPGMKSILQFKSCHGFCEILEARPWCEGRYRMDKVGHFHIVSTIGLMSKIKDGVCSN